MYSTDPFASAIVLSMERKMVGTPAEWVGLANYRELLFGAQYGPDQQKCTEAQPPCEAAYLLTLDNRTPEDTKVVLHHYGNDYYFDKVWIQGKDYGYEFPLPDSVKSRMRERTEAVRATYEYAAGTM